MFTVLFAKILPLYLLILLGYVAGTRLKVDRDAISTLVIYLIVPVVFFGATAQMTVEREFLPLPLLVFVVCASMGLSIYALSKRLWPDARKNLVGYMMGTANQGYFGIPVFLAVFGPQYLGVYVFAGLGISLYESTIGYYLLARGRYTVKESLWRLAKLPLLPAALAGLLFSLSGAVLPPAALEFYGLFKGAYTVLGMMIIGLGLSSLHHLRADLKFTGFILAGKFLCVPLCAWLLLTGYEALAGTLQPITRQIVILLSIMPIAANVVAFSLNLKVEPEKAASAVVISTVFALFYIPFILSFLL